MEEPQAFRSFFDGVVVVGCPDCGHPNTGETSEPVSQMEFRCAQCGREFVVECWSGPRPEEGASWLADVECEGCATQFCLYMKVFRRESVH